MNGELLEQLDTVLDQVDRILLSFDIDKERKAALTQLTYQMYAQAESAVEEQYEVEC